MALLGMVMLGSAWALPLQAAALPTPEARLKQAIELLQPSECEYYMTLRHASPGLGDDGSFQTLFVAKKRADQWAVMQVGPPDLKGRSLLRQGSGFWTRFPAELKSRPVKGEGTFLGGVISNRDLFPLLLEQGKVKRVAPPKDTRKAKKPKDLSDEELLVNNERFGMLLETGHIRVRQNRGQPVMVLEDAIPPQDLLEITPGTGQVIDGYSRGLLSMDRESGRPRQLQLFDQRNRLSRLITYEGMKTLDDGRPHATIIKVHNGTNRGYKSELRLGSLRCSVLPAAAFTPQQLPQLGKLLLR
uniref:Uncharacterized protein TP-0789 domain-containing protein n=1 Tax=Magnetococcus massalia (strain MO-1) TaxID=451514 RepID=A0A1S7LPU6_MAGMO|nr:Conserved exported protein of unknown function [Candidatus Magnetococcus massalia]